ncbi:uncharacterized protein LOC119728801 [Patiria miniata]|uniref:Uncharacterized protein n=1 Tax=Patiria miniata TaxID=46514 RepID=A0A913ZZX7_PATMI|nr:uncharacterized protein LOC119728801 [Patiria miniata]
MMSSTGDNLNLHDDQDFIESLQSASGWTDNPPKLTKSQAPSLSTIMEHEDKATAWRTRNMDLGECDDEDSEPELTLDIELEEGWEKEPRPTAAELASDFEGGAGDNIEDDISTYCRNWVLPPSTRTGSLYRRSPTTPIMMISQSVGPGKLTINTYGNDLPLVEDQLGVTSPEFMMYTPAATPPKKRSVLLQTSANPILAARGRKLSARPRDISSGRGQDSRSDAGDASIRMIPRPEGFIISTWMERKVVSCRAKSINVGSSRSSAFPWPSFSILDEALYFDDKDEIIKYPRDINVRKSRSHPCLPNRTFSGYQSRNASSATYLVDKRNVFEVEAETSSKLECQSDSEINGISPESQEIERQSLHSPAAVIAKSGTAVYNEISNLSALCLQQQDSNCRAAVGPILKETYTGADSYSNFSRFVASEHTSETNHLLVHSGQTDRIFQTKTTAKSSSMPRGSDSNVVPSGSIGLRTRGPSDAKTENQTTYHGNFSNSSSSAAPEQSRRVKAPTKTKTRESQITCITRSKRASAHFNNSSVSASSESTVDETRVTTSQQQADQTRILITGPFRIPPPPPLPRPPAAIPCSKLRKENRDNLTRLKTEKKEDDNTASSSWPITRTSFIQLVDQPIKKQPSIRQASIPLSPNEAEQELMISAIRPIPLPASRINNNHRVVPPINMTNTDDSASRNAPVAETEIYVGSGTSKVHRVEVPRSQKPASEVDELPGWQETPVPKGEPGLQQAQTHTQSTEPKPEEGSSILSPGPKTTLHPIPKSQWRCRFIASTSSQYGPAPDNAPRLVLPVETSQHRSQLTMLSSRSVMTERLETRPPVQFDFTASLREPPSVTRQPVGHVNRRLNIHLVPSYELGARWRPEQTGAIPENRCVSNPLLEDKLGLSLTTSRGREAKKSRSYIKPLAKSYPTQANAYTKSMTYASHIRGKLTGGFTSHPVTCKTQCTSQRQTFMTEASLASEEPQRTSKNRQYKTGGSIHRNM